MALQNWYMIRVLVQINALPRHKLQVINDHLLDSVVLNSYFKNYVHHRLAASIQGSLWCSLVFMQGLHCRLVVLKLFLQLMCLGENNPHFTTNVTFGQTLLWLEHFWNSLAKGIDQLKFSIKRNVSHRFKKRNKIIMYRSPLWRS